VATELTWPEVNARRLARHHLLERAPLSELERVVGDIGAAQAQVMSAAELQIAVRVDCTVRDVREALWKRRTLVKTWLMRGTLHVARADDLPVYTAAMGKRWISQMRPSWLTYMGTTEAEFWHIVEQIGAALDGKPLTREELIAVVGKGKSERVRELLKSGWGGMLKPAARNGRLCFGPNRGQSVKFVRPDAWLDSWRKVDADEALREFARRYLSAYGPATRADFARWWGNWPGVGAAAWESLAQEVVDVSIEGWRAQMLKTDLDQPARAHAFSVQLLPNFDPYLLGHNNRDHLFDAEQRWKVSRVAGWISPVILGDGRVLGVWSHRLNRRRLQVTLTPFAKLPAKVFREAKLRAEALAGSLGVPLERVALT
jgi:hypothetical protein